MTCPGAGVSNETPVIEPERQFGIRPIRATSIARVLISSIRRCRRHSSSLDALLICRIAWFTESPRDPRSLRMARQQGIHPRATVDRGRDWSAMMRSTTVGSTIGRGPLARFDPDLDSMPAIPSTQACSPVAVLRSRRRTWQRSTRRSGILSRRARPRGVDLAIEALFFATRAVSTIWSPSCPSPCCRLAELICRAAPARSRCPSRRSSAAPAISTSCTGWAPRARARRCSAAGPVRIYALLWSFVGRSRDCWIAAGYERLPECVGYSLWRHHHERASGPMSLRARLHWSWTDLKKRAASASAA